MLGLARLLVVFRLRSLWNGWWRVPRRPSLRVAWLMVLAAPAAYVALFASAFVALRGTDRGLQAALLALVCCAITAASCLAKMASSDAVVAGTGENEFLLARPVSLGRLVLARSLAGAVTDLWGALFLLPVLLAAGLAWELGPAGLALAAATSVLAHVGVAGTAQAGQIAVVRFVPPARRRTVWAALALLAALAMAGVWVLGTQVVRAPHAAAQALAPWANVLALPPLGVLAGPIRALAVDGAAAAAAQVATLAGTIAAVLVLTFVFARWAARDGWENANMPWAESGRGAREAAGPLTPFGKEIRLLLRDRSRLVALAVAPAIFVGIQVFGSAGWEWIAADPRHAAVMAFSLAAYMATYGPLGHMAAERHAFWLLRMSPYPLGRLMAYKALFWAVMVAGAAGLVYAGVFLLSPLPVTREALGLGVSVLAGAALVAGLAVAMGCSGADLSDEHRPVLGVGTVWLFMLTAALFNAALLGDGQVRVRAFILYVLCAGLHWVAGIEHAAWAYDPASRVRGRALAGDGATLAILLYLGRRGGGLALPAASDHLLWAGTAWSGILAAAAVAYLGRGSVPALRRGRLASMAVAMAVGGAAALVAPRAGWPGLGLATVALTLAAVAEEVIVRGIVQRSLAERWASSGAAGALAAFAVSTLVALAAGARPFGPAALVAAAGGALAFTATGRTGAALLARLMFELLP